MNHTTQIVNYNLLNKINNYKFIFYVFYKYICQVYSTQEKCTKCQC